MPILFTQKCFIGWKWCLVINFSNFIYFFFSQMIMNIIFVCGSLSTFLFLFSLFSLWEMRSQVQMTQISPKNFDDFWFILFLTVTVEIFWSTDPIILVFILFLSQKNHFQFRENTKQCNVMRQKCQLKYEKIFSQEIRLF